MMRTNTINPDDCDSQVNTPIVELHTVDIKELLGDGQRRWAMSPRFHSLIRFRLLQTDYSHYPIA